MIDYKGLHDDLLRIRRQVIHIRAEVGAAADKEPHGVEELWGELHEAVDRLAAAAYLADDLDERTQARTQEQQPNE